MKNGYFLQPRQEMLPFLPQNARAILDVGCGSGAFGALLKEKYPDARLFGIELDSSAAEDASKVFDHVWNGDVCHTLALRPDTFDLVVFNDVLEHIPEPWHCLRLTKDVLLPGAVVVASIPNMRFWPILSDLFFQGNWNYRDAGVMDKSHLRFFTKRSIGNLFDKSGYEIVRIDGINGTWKRSLRWRILNSIFRGRFSDCLFPQFAVVALPLQSTVNKT